MKTVSVHTLGCKLNYAETSSIGRQFRERGYSIVDASERSNVFVLNTCSVTERADRECRQLIRRVRRNSPETYIIVVGCYAQLQPEVIASIEGVDLVLGTQEKFNLFDFTAADHKEQKTMIRVSSVSASESIGKASSIGSYDRTRAFLKIQDGCDYNCSFCTIPIARGLSRSLPIEEILPQVLEVVQQEYKEVVLTGVNVGDYGKKIQTSLLSLLKRIASVDGLERIRISSIEPNLLNDDLLDFWLTERKLCKHFHIPLQSGSDNILGLMRRRYLTSRYAQRIEKIKMLRPDAGIGADVLVGFPGETDRLFEHTFDFLRELPLSYLHIFPYSERPNTDAINLPGRVEPRVRAERSERLRMLSLRKRRLFNETFIGKTEKVLFEHQDDAGWWSGFTEQYVRVRSRSIRPLTNCFLPVHVDKANDEYCSGSCLHRTLSDQPLPCDGEVLQTVTQ